MNGKSKHHSTIEQEIIILKKFISNCELIPSDSIAIRVSITALDNEFKRLQRDEKLRKKFSGDISTASTTTSRSLLESRGVTLNIDKEEEVDLVKVSSSAQEELLIRSKHKNQNSMMNEDRDDGCLIEWQKIDFKKSTTMGDSADHSSKSMDTEDEGGFASMLANAAIADLSKAGVKVFTPTAALALLLHSVLRGEQLGFKCMGLLTDDEYSLSIQGENKNRKDRQTKRGFAPPVRELSKNMFVPEKWDSNASEKSDGLHHVLLRYRKNLMATTVLRVGLMDTTTKGECMAKVNFGIVGLEPTELIFPLDKHINLDGLNAALSIDAYKNGVKPSLHYKALKSLINEFCQANDLGAIMDGNDASGSDVSVQYRVAPIPAKRVFGIRSTNKAEEIPTMNHTDGMRKLRPTFQDDLMGNHFNTSDLLRSDFSDDLLPSNLKFPGFSSQPPKNGGMTGNLMGPNHPSFLRGCDGNHVHGGRDFLNPGGLGMQPRVDPYFPPGVCQDELVKDNERSRGRRKLTSGDPNHDHQRKPNNLNNYMFM